MNGIVFDLKRFATHDGPGIRTSVFLKGCPLKCQWCHNPESINPQPEEIIIYDRKKSLNLSCSTTIHQIGKEISAEELFNEFKKDKIFYEESNGGVTFTGGEPLFQTPFLKELLQLCKSEGIHTALDTSGYADFESFKQINDLVDLYLYDLKLMDPEQHLKYTLTDNQLILDNLQKLNSIAKNIWIRIPLIPGINDTQENIQASANFLSHLIPKREVCLLPFNSLFENKYHKFKKSPQLNGLKRQNEDKLAEIKSVFETSQLSVQIGG
jgi:pyruvate formate lyase activating enzyme